MANAREIKLRIKGINATMKITKAMTLISAAKLKKARAMHEATMPFFSRIQNTMSNILQRLPDMESVYFEKRRDPFRRTDIYTGERGSALVLDRNEPKTRREDQIAGKVLSAGHFVRF